MRHTMKRKAVYNFNPREPWAINLRPKSGADYSHHTYYYDNFMSILI